jgi:SpoU rRNA methylase family enzyme
MALAGVHQSIPGLQQVTGKILFLNDLSDALEALAFRLCLDDDDLISGDDARFDVTCVL